MRLAADPDAKGTEDAQGEYHRPPHVTGVCSAIHLGQYRGVFSWLCVMLQKGVKGPRPWMMKWAQSRTLSEKTTTTVKGRLDISISKTAWR